MAEQILLVGATLLDSRGKPNAGLEPGTSNPSQIRVTRGGTARNVAENLGLLGAKVKLISAVGADMTGQHLLKQTAASGIDTEYVQVLDGERTGAYIAVLEENGELSVALDDVRVLRHISASYLDRHRGLFKEADMVMMDGSLTEDAMATVVRLCNKYDKPLCADPSSARLAYKLRPFLSHLHLVVPNEVEAAELCEVDYDGPDPEASLDLARCLVGKGVRNVVVTLANFGLDYATSRETGYIPANYSEMVDSSGTGAAVTAAILFGMLNELSPIESIRLGAAAASLTLQTAETVVPDLSLDMLYDHLIV
ncbi:MAG: hypothetical protein GY805_12925 [Chloroflexi bacterium]|nr:hypothetical protein [Chloroflexota bacterium]